jgi:hypothetical protein
LVGLKVRSPPTLSNTAQSGETDDS